MTDDLMPFDLPKNENSIIKVLGVGGGGSNAVNHMFRQGIRDVNFVVCNTDAQALAISPVPVKIQLGGTLTEGRGAGNKPEMGREAAIENINDVTKIFSSTTKMVFITAGMGGGTGTGAAPIIAKAAKDMKILTVGIVTIPFRFEGQRRIRQAVDGINELRKHVDSLLIIRNEKLREITGDLPISKAFAHADDVLTTAAKGIADIITQTGHVNVDFADVQTVMTNSGVALMGNGLASGPDRALKAVQMALNSPLLSNNEIKGAKNLLLNICSGEVEASMDELYSVNNYVQDLAGYGADLIWGSYSDPALGDKLSVTVIATGFETDAIPELYTPQEVVKTELKDELETPISKKNEIDELFGFTLKEPQKKTEKASDIFELIDNPPSTNSYFDDLDLSDSDEFDIIDTAKPMEPSKPIAQEPMAEVNYREKVFRNPNANIDEREKIPAYIRKEMKLELGVNYSTQKDVSRYTLSDDDSLLSENNQYLHDNVD
ncbi:MAG TPA: cell division protein FtsZ [Bacteroidales bacterium]|nr:cell division protein FtsZ [Bacteroidales bacterium]